MSIDRLVRVSMVQRCLKFCGTALGCLVPSQVLRNGSGVSSVNLYDPEQYKGHVVTSSRSEVSLCINLKVLCLLPYGWCQNVAYQMSSELVF